MTTTPTATGFTIERTFAASVEAPRAIMELAAAKGMDG
jgi:hypothetical protein